MNQILKSVFMTACGVNYEIEKGIKIKLSSREIKNGTKKLELELKCNKNWSRLKMLLWLEYLKCVLMTESKTVVVIKMATEIILI